MKNSRLLAICMTSTALLFLLSDTALGQSLDAHVHGEAQVAVVVEDQTVSISMMSAMYNITGFEHAPENDAQRSVLETAMAQLDDAAGLFALSKAAKCSVTRVDHSNPLEDDHDHDHQGHEDGEHNPEAREHIEHDHDDHAAAVEEAHHHDGDDEDEHHHHHRDLEADYEFTCKKPAELKTIRFELFNHFENLEKINVVVIAGGKQTAAELTGNHPTLAVD